MKNLRDYAQRDDELFDVVDENDRVTSVAARAVVHRHNLRHRAVHAWVFNRKGKFFLQKRSMLKDTAPGKWDSSCSGHVNSGENYDEAVIRELEEELMLRPGLGSQLARLFKSEAQPETSWEFTQVYRLFDEGPFRLHPAEIESGDWFSPEDIDNNLNTNPDAYSPTFRHLWQLRPGEIISGEWPPVRLR